MQRPVLAARAPHACFRAAFAGSGSALISARNLPMQGRMRVLVPRLGRHRRRAGFSMVELMVAITLLLVATSGTLLANVAARNLTRTSRETRAATLAAAAALEGMLVEPLAELVAQHPEGKLLAVGEFGLRDMQVVPAYPDYVAGAELLRIQLTVSWTTFEGAARTMVFETAKR